MGYSRTGAAKNAYFESSMDAPREEATCTMRLRRAGVGAEAFERGCGWERRVSVGGVGE